MSEYHKIQTVFKRDPLTNHKNLLIGEFSLDEFGYLQDNLWAFTEKVDGTNIRIIVDTPNKKITFGGKTDAAQIPANLGNRLNNLVTSWDYGQAAFKQFPDGAVLYFEGYGAKIQKGGGNYSAEQDVVLFDVRVGDWWLRRNDVESIGFYLGVRVVPLIGVGTIRDMVGIVEQGFKSQWGDFTAEGIVARPLTELRTRDGHRIITKLKHKDFVPAK